MVLKNWVTVLQMM